MYVMTVCLSMFSLEVTVHMENAVYQVLEDVGSVQVCAVIHNPHSTDCPIDFSISVRLSTSDGTAGS